jgi:hypothetical protein
MTVPTRPTSDGGYSALNITTGTNFITGRCTVFKVTIVTSAAAASTVIDSAGTSATAANTILTIPASTAAGTVYTLNWPCFVGLSVIPGASVVLACTYSEGALG